MFISCAPLRVSFVGGGSDILGYYLEHGGAVLSCSITQYSYAIIHPYFEWGKYNLKYVETELVDDADAIRHPIFREAIKALKVEGGLEIASIADTHGRAGLGSSSAFCVALLNGLHAQQNRFATMQELAEEACDIEIKRLGEPIGKQDQYAAAMGGINFIEFNENGSVSVQPPLLPRETVAILESSLLLFDSGLRRDASEVLGHQAAVLDEDDDKLAVVGQMAANAYKLRDMLIRGECENFGRALHENWLIKRSLTERISSPVIDGIYDLAMEKGALGGKLCGAGGGGFLSLYCPPEAQGGLREALRDLNELEFRFDWNGARIALAQ
ncbi:MAG: kinase [Rhodospirillales bacterium]|nr:kinase [Rhodospirillales bacterium]